ncbi:MAG TPA: DUF4386 domain-containing protein [Gemmatimonadaceae bacterium]|nr:DUF4386 domain-containing protein [Gemmatimonadaceae bacterium]
MTAYAAPDGPAPRGIARSAGVVWLLYFLISSVGLALMKGIVVAGDAATTAANLHAHPAMFQAGSSLTLLGDCVYIALTVLLYAVFRRVDRNLALLAAAFSLIGCTTQIVGALFRIAPLVLLTDNQPFAAFSAPQLQVASLISLQMFNRVFNVSFVLFGFFEIVLGYLILKSPFLRRWLGWVFIVAGVGGLTFLWPTFATRIFPVIVVLGIGELILAVWLIVKGPTIDRWESA